MPGISGTASWKRRSAAQGRTVQRVILGMSSHSLPAMNMEQLYVSASRAKEWIRLYTDDKAEVRDAVKRSSQKLAALDLRPKRPEPLCKPSEGMQQHMERRRRLSVINWMRSAWDRARPQPKEKQKERQADHGYRTMTIRGADAAEIDPPCRNRQGGGSRGRRRNRRKTPGRSRRRGTISSPCRNRAVPTTRPMPGPATSRCRRFASSSAIRSGACPTPISTASTWCRPTSRAAARRSSCGLPGSCQGKR